MFARVFRVQVNAENTQRSRVTERTSVSIRPLTPRLVRVPTTRPAVYVHEDPGSLFSRV